MTTRTGRCECGAVRYSVTGPMRDIIACHCTQCRRTSGHFWAATAAPHDAVTIAGQDALKWYRSSDRAERGFCIHCGSSLFYRHDAKPYTAIGAGTLDGATGLPMPQEIFLADKGDYYMPSPNTEHHEHWKEA